MARNDFRFQRGEYVRDILTGYAGVIVSRTDSITGCDRYCIQPTVDKENKYVEALWFDDHCLEYDPKFLGQKIDLALQRETPPG